MSVQKAMLAAGDFRATEHAFRQVPGVVATQVGYIGGHTRNPTYAEVQTDTTGHAEAIEVMYDTDVVSYETLLEAFWSCHDPTQLNRQGVHVGSEYRSAVFTGSPEQKATAERARKAVAKAGRFTRPIMTEIVQAGEFFPAEDEYQEDYAKQGVKNPGPEGGLARG